MSTVRIVISTAAGLLVLSGIVFAMSEVLQRTHDERSLIARSITRIVVVSDSGDVTIRAGLTRNVMIDQRDGWLLNRPSMTAQVRGSTLSLRTTCGALRAILRCRSDLTLDAPPEIDVDVRTHSGDVDLRGLSGRAIVRTDSGNIITQRLAPVTLSADTAAGNVMLDLYGQPARTEARSKAGNVHVTVPFGPYHVDATTDAGRVQVEGIIRDDLAPQAIAALTGAGDITVRAR